MKNTLQHRVDEASVSQASKPKHFHSSLAVVVGNFVQRLTRANSNAHAHYRRRLHACAQDATHLRMRQQESRACETQYAHYGLFLSLTPCLKRTAFPIHSLRPRALESVHHVAVSSLLCWPAEEVRQGQVNYVIRITCAIKMYGNRFHHCTPRLLSKR